MRAIFIFILLPSLAFSQSARIVWIKDAVRSIEKNRTLSCDTLDAFAIYNVSFDGGGEVIYCYRGKELVKIREEIGLSWGRSTTEYYFHKDTIMHLREREETFPLTADSAGIDHSRLVTSYAGSHYLWTWRNELQVKERSERIWSGPPDRAQVDLYRLLLHRRKR